MRDINASIALVVPTAYGQMILHRMDINQTTALVRTGRSLDHEEIVLLSGIVGILGDGRGGAVIADVGANFGAFTLAMARAAGPRGRVHAFEPQRVLFHMLAGSVALNGLLNVECHHQAVGDQVGRVELPQFDYHKPLNFGSVEFGSEQREKLDQPRQHDPARVEYVPLTTLDHYEWDRLDLLKIDVEGMEMSVLAGAEQTIRRCQPVIFVEFIKVDRVALKQRMLELGYAVYENRINYLCVPAQRQDQIQVRDGKIVMTGQA